MTGSLARIEVRHLARSPLLWLGFALGVAFAMLNSIWCRGRPGRS
jgi:hypothetical protein